MMELTNHELDAKLNQQVEELLPLLKESNSRLQVRLNRQMGLVQRLEGLQR